MDRSGPRPFRADRRTPLLASVLLLVPGQAAHAQSTTRASLAPGDVEIATYSPLGGDQNCISDDGRFVLFSSDDDGVVPGDTNNGSDLFLRDLWLGETHLVSRNATGKPGNNFSWQGALSADGSTVVFASAASNLVVPDQNVAVDVFAWDRATDTMTRLSDSYTGTQSHGGMSEHPSVSSDGRLVAFSGFAVDLVPGDTNGEPDIFVHDRSTGITTRISLTDTGAEADNYRWSSYPTISRDGGTVCFMTDADLVTGDTKEVHLHAVDLATGAIELVDLTESGSPTVWTTLRTAYLSADGRYVAFHNIHGDILDGDADAYGAVYLRDRELDVTELISVDSQGNSPDEPFGLSVQAISADGRFVVFYAIPAAIDDDTLGSTIYVRDRAYGFTLPIAYGDDDVLSDLGSAGGALSGDGRFCAFGSADGTLVDDDTNGVADLFVRERIFDAASLVDYGSGAPGRFGIPSFALNDLPVLGEETTLSIGNSSGLWTVAALLVGTASADVPIWGGTLLVAPAFSFALPLAPGGSDVDVAIPIDEVLVGIPLYAQALLLDPWAVDGVALTAGIEATPGY